MRIHHARRAVLALAVLAIVAVPSAPAPLAAQSALTEYEGAMATGLALRRLGNTARVLHIGAHPDDENTALFAPLALGRGAAAAYLSLTRGEGGQNGIGPELGVALGLIRSEELLAARRLDGGDQFFARAIDYGYSKSAEEAFRHWPRDSLVADVVAEIRRYRPDIVISVWSGTPRDGHGQHEAAGLVAMDAVLAAGDPTRFPEQIEAGLRPHRPAHFYWSGRFSEDGPDVELSTGELDPLLGRSYHQIAMASRSRHRSQDMGVPQAPGPRSTAFDRIDPENPPPVGTRTGFGGRAGAPTITGSLFEGVDTLLSGRADRAVLAAPAADRRALEEAAWTFRRYEEIVFRARERFDALAPWEVLAPLDSARALLEAGARALPDASRGPAADAVRDLRFHVREELADLRQAILLSANVRLDVVASEELLVPGQTFELRISVWNGGVGPVTAQAVPHLPPGWSATLADGAEALLAGPGERAVAVWRVRVPDDAPPTTPYFLAPDAARDTLDLYRWPDDPDIRGLPFAPDPVRGTFTVRVGSEARIPVVRAASWVGVDRRSGEYRRRVRVVPAVSVELAPAVAVLPLDRSDPLAFRVRLRSEAPEAVEGRVRVDVPAGWSVDPAAAAVRLDGPGEERELDFRVTPPRDAGAGDLRVGAVLQAGDRSYALGYRVIDYPHIEPRHLYARPRSLIRAFDVRVADVRVGYVPGAGDDVPGMLDQLGLAWERIDPGTLGRADLDRFDVILTGIRAYEVRPELGTHNDRLLDWVRRGGTLIVQYNQYEFAARGFAPWPVTIARPHGRVTDPDAPVTILEPGHPVFNTPNRIGPADWEGWVQERGLYFLESWEGAFTPLLAMSDPGEDPLTGSLLVAPVGQGTYVYTGLAFFRQLPAGVPGAYRLLANLISLGARGPDAAGRTDGSGR